MEKLNKRISSINHNVLLTFLCEVEFDFLELTMAFGFFALDYLNNDKCKFYAY